MRKALRNESVQSFVSAILCIVLGLLIGYIVLLIINPSGAGESILNIIKNFYTISTIFITKEGSNRRFYDDMYS